MTPGRHTLVSVAPEDWGRLLAGWPARRDLAPDAGAALDAWAARGWPAIVRRRAAGDPPDALPLGVPLPPALGRLRCALALPAGTAWGQVRTPPLLALRGTAPPAWHATIDAVLALGRAAGLAPRAFGSLLWQGVTGLSYLGAGSDLDLLWTVGDATDLDGLLEGLARIDAAGPVRLDGEIVLPDGAGVNWREFHRARAAPGGEVLAKTDAGLSLRDAAAPTAQIVVEAAAVNRLAAGTGPCRRRS